MKLIEQRRQGGLFFSISLCQFIGNELQNQGLKKFVPRGYGLNKMACGGDEIRWFFDETDLIEAGTILAEQLWKNPHEVNLLFGYFDKIALLQIRYCESLVLKRFQHATNEELVTAISEFWVCYQELFDLGTFAELLDFSLQRLLSKELFSQNIPVAAHANLIALLSNPEEESFSKQAEKNVLQIACRLLEHNKNDPAAALSTPKIQTLLQQHVNQFYWSSCNYFSFSGLGLKNLKKLVLEACQNAKTPEKILAEIAASEQEIQSKKQALLEKYNLNSKTLFLFELARRTARLFDERKKAQMYGFYSIGRVLKELAWRQEVDFDLAKYLFPWEVKEFAAGKISTAILQSRREYTFVDYNSHPMQVLTGKDAQSAEEALWKKTTLTKEEVNGSCASPGVAVGFARVITSKKSLSELQPSEILVTGMTDPDFVPYLKNAIGIIADDGGITSHSAIISRELRIPCIVGTKTATKVIRTGDKIELRAHHGLARVMERKNTN